jgi:succinate dehydrogenase / fumarate reductase cytochrome b subunit
VRGDAVTEDTSPAAAVDRRAFVLRRVMSLTGVVPLGVFVLAHLAAMTAALRGPDAFSRALATPSPVRLGLEATLIGVPLLVHAGVGLAATRSARVNVRAYPYSSNLAWLLQRVTGLVVLAFLVLHVWEHRVKVLLGQADASDFHYQLVVSLSSTGPLGFPFHACFYLLGVGATAYHLANGLVGFAASFGLVTTRRGLRTLGLVAAALGTATFLVSAAVLLHLATGSASPWGST